MLHLATTGLARGNDSDPVAARGVDHHHDLERKSPQVPYWELDDLLAIAPQAHPVRSPAPRSRTIGTSTPEAASSSRSRGSQGGCQTPSPIEPGSSSSRLCIRPGAYRPQVRSAGA